MIANVEQEFLRALDAMLIQKLHRLASLHLLGKFVTSQPPDLSQVLDTPLLDHLLRCLTIDTSTAAVSLAITALSLLLPCVPAHIPPMLPQLFIIYNRLLCWDRYYPEYEFDRAEEDRQVSPIPQSPPKHQAWEKLDQTFNIGPSQPDILHYWTVLYGLYPLNLMRFIREPNEYLRMSNWGLSECEGLDQQLLGDRSRASACSHFVHENFFTMTIESELVELEKWNGKTPAGLATELIGLYGANFPDYRGSLMMDDGRPESLSDGRDSRVPTEDIPWDSLMSNNSEDDASTIVASTSSLSMKSPMRDNSAFGRPLDRKSMYDPRRPGANPRGQSFPTPSQWSVSMDAKHNYAPTPDQHPAGDSPTIPGIPHSSSEAKLNMLLGQRISTVALPHRSVSQLQKGHLPPTDGAAQSSGEEPPTPLKASGSSLQQQVILLTNDLHFERYLRAQHLSHIGQLQKKQITESSFEGEVRAQRNNNMILKLKLNESRDDHNKLKQKMDKTKADTKKWGADLVAEMKVLRDQQKSWSTNEAKLEEDLIAAQQEIQKLQSLVRESDDDKLRSYERTRAMETSMLDLDGLRIENERLERIMREYQEKRAQFEEAQQKLSDLEIRMEQMHILWEARQGDHENKVSGLQKQLRNAEYQSKPRPGGQAEGAAKTAGVAAMIESAVAASRRKYDQERMKFLAADKLAKDLQDQLDAMKHRVAKHEHIARFNRVHEPRPQFEDNGPAVDPIQLVRSDDRLPDAISAGSKQPSLSASSHSDAAEIFGQLSPTSLPPTSPIGSPIGSRGGGGGDFSFDNPAFAGQLSIHDYSQQQHHPQSYPPHGLQQLEPQQQLQQQQLRQRQHSQPQIQSSRGVPIMANQNLPRNVIERSMTSATGRTTGGMTIGSQESGNAGAGTDGEADGGVVAATEPGSDGKGARGAKPKITPKSEIRMRGRGELYLPLQVS